MQSQGHVKNDLGTKMDSEVINTYKWGKNIEILPIIERLTFSSHCS